MTMTTKATILMTNVTQWERGSRAKCAGLRPSFQPTSVCSFCCQPP